MNWIVEPKTEKYIYSLLPARDRVMREMERYAQKHHVPIIGPACGRLLYQLARLVRARRVFEMGSAIGYSTLWLARAVGPEGRVFYTDGDPANARRAEGYLGSAGVLGRVRVLVGDALHLLDSVPGVGKILGLVLLYEIHDIARFPTVQDFASYCRLVKCAKESAGKRSGTSGKKIGNAYLK